jgi:hypothetical protein
MKKFSLINVAEDFNIDFQEGDVIEFEMPSFCTGDYKAVVKKDPFFGFYINKKDARFEGCRDFEVYRNGEKI